MAHKRASTRMGRRIIALVARDEPTDPSLGEALARLHSEDGVLTDADVVGEARLAEALEGAEILIVGAGLDQREIHDRLATATATSETEPPLFVSLVEAGVEEDSLSNHPAFNHYLARPFRPETLCALCTTLLEERSGGVAGSGVAVRRPTRFSARPLYGQAEAFARDCFDAARENGVPDMGTARLIAERIHTSLLQSNLLLNRALEPYKRFEIATHCANVGVIAGKIGLSLDLSLDERLQLIQIGLIHDIGMSRLPDSILHKEGRLTDGERAEMQRHPELGSQIARRLGPDYDWLATAILQEHERANGDGYPSGLAGAAIDRLAQIIGVADVFEAFSHLRSYRSPFTAFEALERVMSMREDAFAGHIVDALADEISVFPLDSYVRLSTGAIGRVVETNPANLMRPMIELLWNEEWSPIEPMVVSLDQSPEMAIERPLHESEVPIT